MDAKQMAQELIDYFGGLGPLLKADREAFCSAKGLGQAKFCQLQATLELRGRYLTSTCVQMMYLLALKKLWII